MVYPLSLIYLVIIGYFLYRFLKLLVKNEDEDDYFERDEE